MQMSRASQMIGGNEKGQRIVTTREELEGWIAQVALGNRAAFSSLYGATSAKLFGVCLSVLKDRGEAEEVLQEVYVRLWRNAGRYQANGLSPMTWLITIARNAAIDRLRRRPVASVTLDAVAEPPDRAPGPEGTAIARSEAREVQRCMEELEDRRATAVRGAYLEGKSYSDLADLLDVPLNTIRTWLRRSLIQLRECLGR